MEFEKLKKIATYLRYLVLTATTQAGSGHPSSCLSMVELAEALFFGSYYRYDTDNPDNLKNDRVIFSKGHAAPLFYALYTVSGIIKEEELMMLRKSESSLEGHPTQCFPFTEVPTGSLGQGLSAGLGMALAGVPRVYVFLGDSELAEGSNWEAIELASYYKAQNLVGIADINRLGQSGETMLSWNIETYEKRIQSYGWNVIRIEDGNNLEQVVKGYSQINFSGGKPTMILAKTIKGKGISIMENKEGWHGKVLSSDQLEEALKEMGEVDKNIRGVIRKPE
jgi:transketolase